MAARQLLPSANIQVGNANYYKTYRRGKKNAYKY